MSLIRRLAARYRGLPAWGRLLILGLLMACHQAPAGPPLLAISAALLIGVVGLDLRMALLLTAACIPLANLYKHVGGDIYSPLELLVVACGIAWAIRLRRGGVTSPLPSAARHGRRPPLAGADWAVLAFLIAALLSLRAAEDQARAAWSLRTLVFEPCLLYLILRTTPTDKGLLLGMADALMAGAVAVSLLGLYQYFFTAYVEAAEGVRRILSLYDSPNHLGLYLDRVIPVSLSLAIFGLSRWRRIGHAAGLVVLTSALFLTFSRGAWLLGLPAGLLAIGILAGPRARAAALVLLVVTLLALLPVAATPRFASLFNLQEGTSFNRLLIWQGSLRMIREHPLWGVGAGNFVAQYPRFMSPEAWREPVIYHAHNGLLDFWSMLGLPGVVAFLGLVAAFFGAASRAHRRLVDGELRALALGLLAGMAGALAHGLVDTVFFLPDLAFVFMLMLGITAHLPTGPMGAPQPTHRQARSRGTPPCAQPK